MAKRKPPITEVPAGLASLGDALRARGLRVADSLGPGAGGTPAVPNGTARAPATAAKPAAHGAPDLSRSGKLVVRRERKGHGGKTVTVIEGMRMSASQLEEVARTLRKILGCGSRVENGCVLLQGDLVAPVEKWLRARGATQVVHGN